MNKLSRAGVQGVGVGGLLLLGGLLLGSLAGSCGPVLGDVEITPNPLQPSVLGADAGAGATDCEVGESRCRGQLAEICVRLEPEQPGTFRPLQDCGTQDLCVADPDAHCVRRSCEAGEASCAGATPRVCNTSQTGWNERPDCLSEAHCSTSPGSCGGSAPCCLTAPCTPGEMRCNEGEMQRCSADQTAWEPVDACVSAELCLGSLAACGPSPADCACQEPTCEAGATRCDEAILTRCNAAQTAWEPIEPCATAALCNASQALGTLTCVPPACELGSFTCTETGVLRSCRADRTGFDDLQTCDGAPFCNLTDGRCETAPCQAGQRRCNGAQIEICLDDRTAFIAVGAPCATPALCNDTDPANVRCDPPVCDVNAATCSGSTQLLVCNEGRTALAPVGAPCPRPDLCSADRRRCDFCVPGRQECTPELDASRVCSLSGNFFGPETACPLGCDGPVGQCRTCPIGSYSCNGNIIARCNDGRSFTPLNRATDCAGPTQFSCNNGQLTSTNCGVNGCNVARASCNECNGQQRICAGLGFRQCSQGVFGPVQACADGLDCRGAGSCGCDALAARCAGDVLQVCNALGTAFDPAEACGGADGAVLRTCALNQLTELPCSSAEACLAAVDGVCE